MLDLIMGSPYRKKLQAVITNNTGTTVLTEEVTQIQVTASGGTMYEWSGGATPLLPTNTFTAPGTYTVTVRQGNGIPATASIIITQDTPSAPEFDYYIDPDNNNAGRDGSIANPYQSIAEAGGLADNTSYGFKAGSETILTSELSFANRTNTLIGVYGTNETDSLFKLKATSGGTCAVRFAGSTNCTLMGFDLYSDLSISLITLIQGGSGTGFSGGSGNIIANGKVHGSKQGTSDGGMGLRVGGSNWQIVGVEIYDTGSDGIYVQDGTGFLFSNLNIHHVNQNYAGAAVGFNNLGSGASGDGIQLDGSWNGFIIRNTTVDRSDAYTGNKFNLICNSAVGLNTNSSGLIEGCTFISNSVTPWAVYLEQGDGIEVRKCRFNGPTGGIRISNTTGQTFTNKNSFIHHNIFVNCSSGVGVAYGGTTPDTRNTRVYNNVFYKCNYHTWVDRSFIDVRNNIHLRDGDSGVAIYNYGSGLWTIMNNCYGDAATAGTPGTGTNPQIGNPGFVDAANGDFHLQLTSICRNAGIDVGIDEDYDGVAIPQETNPAIGAFEPL